MYVFCQVEPFPVTMLRLRGNAKPDILKRFEIKRNNYLINDGLIRSLLFLRTNEFIIEH